MQIIKEREPDRYGVYCSAIGWLGVNSGMDKDIAVRTLVFDNHGAGLWPGGSIVADSDWEAEYPLRTASSRTRQAPC